MNVSKKVGWFAGAASAAWAGVAFGGSTPAPDTTDARIAALEAQIADLKADSSSWLKTEEARALVQEVLADSETRSSLLQGDAMAGYRDGSGFFLSNADGTFDLNIGFYTQIRAVFNNKDSADEQTFGIENRRTKFIADGHAGDERLTYKIQGAFDVDGGAFTLEDAFVVWAFENGFDVGAGQFKAPFLREELTSATAQLAVERSYVNELTTIGRTQGVWGHWDSDQFRFWASFNEGAVVNDAGVGPAIGLVGGETANTPFFADGSEWAATGRVEFLAAGEGWDQFDDFTSWSEDEFGFLIGGAIHWQDEEYGTGAEETQVLLWTIDASAEFGQANLFGYIVGAHTDPNSDAVEEADQFGAVVQGGWHFVPDEWEVFGRFEWYDFDEETTQTGEDTFSAATIGVNRYFRRHQVKWTTDVVWCLDGVPASATGLGLLQDAADDEDQLAVRSQIQVAVP